MATVVVVMREVPKPNGDKEWTILAENEGENRRRFNPHKPDIKDRWASRHPKGPTPGSDHLPIIFDEGDTLQFKNDTGYPIGIGVKKNADVDEFPGAPDDPLEGRPGVQPLAAGATVDAYVIKAGDAMPGPKHQGFYKFHGFVNVGGTFISIDPDGYCGG